MIKHRLLHFIFILIGLVFTFSNAQAITVTWNGTAWTPSAPNNTDDAVIAGKYSASVGSFDANSLTINAGFTFEAFGSFNITTNVTNNGIVVLGSGFQGLYITGNLVNNGTINNCSMGTLSIIGTTSGGGTINTIGATEPTDAGMGMIGFASVTATSFTINLSAVGDGAKRIIVVKPNSAVAGSAVIDGGIYTANANFSGGGSVIDGTGKVVYNNNGTSVTVTGLTNMVTYHVAVFEFNETGNCTNYKTDTFLSNNQLTGGAAATTWNGTMWDNGTPNNVTNAIINGNYSTQTNGNFTCAQLTVNFGQTLTIHGAGLVTVNTATVNNFGTINDCNPAPGLSGAGTVAPNPKTTPTFPTNEASGITFNNITSTSFDISWVNGDGDKRVVVVKPTSTVNVNALAIGTTYTANANFGMGTVIDGTAKVVFNGAGTTVSVTGLAGGTTYHIAIFEYSETGACAPSYKLGTPAAASQMTNAGPANTTWNGTMWNNGAPGATTNAIINGNYNTATNGNITAFTMTVNATFTLTVAAAGLVDVTGAITNNGTIDNCLQGTINGTIGGGGTVKTVIAEPTTAASALNFTGVTANGFTINWTNGNGAKRIVVVKPNTAVATNAVADGSAYTANANFGGAGSTVDGTGKVVYSNNLNTVTVTGLAGGTTYHVAVFEYDENVNCGANYKTNVILSGSQATNGTTTTWTSGTWDNGAPNATVNAVIAAGTYNTGTSGGITALSLTVNASATLTLATAGSVVITNALTNNGTINNCEPRTLTFGSFAGTAVNIAATEPTTEAITMTFSAVSSTGFTINWGNGDGAKRIVVVKPTTAVSTTAAIDGTAYTADANFGGTGAAIDGTGKVVFNGTATSVVVTGLTANTTYHIAIFEFNETGCGANYKTGTPLAGNRLTDGTPTTWNGAAWSNGAPNATTDATIAGAYSTASGNITAKNLTINAGQTLTVAAVAASVTVNGNLVNNGTFNNCIGGTVTVTGTTTGGAVQVKATEPTVEVPNVTIGSVLSNQFIVSFPVAGNGAKRVVVVKQGSAVNVNALTDGTAYTADASFTGMGSVVDGTAKVVYSNNGFGVTVTQLLPNTTYHVAVFEYNESVGCGANYKIGSPTTASQTTAIATTTTWNGTAWDNGVPNIAVDAVIAGNYSTANGNITTDVLTINAGQTLTVHAATATVQANMLTNNGTISNCAGGTFNPMPTGIVILPAPTPTLDASNVTFSNVQERSLTATWVNGNGSSRVVVIRASSNPNGSGSLIDGATYLADPNFGSGSQIEGGTVVYNGNGVNSINISGLSPGVLYFVSVYEYNTNMDCGNNYRQGGGGSGTIVTALNLPAPLALEAREITAEGFLARWEMPNNTVVGSFEIDIATDQAFTRILSNYNKRRVFDEKLSIKDLEPNTTYFYRLRAVASTRTSANSNIIRVVTLPKAPKALDATNVATGGFNANWEAVAGADSYELQYAVTLPNYTTVKVSGSNTATFKVENLPTEEAFQKINFYYYRVRAITKDGLASAYSNQITVKAVPPAPVATEATNIKETSLNANWQEVKSADNYILELAEDKDFKIGVVSREVKELSSNFTNLKEGKTYFYRVKTKNTSGESGFSNVIETSTLPSVPTELKLVSATGGRFTVSWTASRSELAVTYLIDVATDANFSSISIRQQRATATTAILQPNNFVGGRTYFVRVWAVHEKNRESGFSNVLSIISAPATPRLSLVADKTTENSFDLSWSNVETADSYELDVATNATFTNLVANYNAKSIKELQTSVTGINGFTVYFCRLRAVNASGKSDNSNVIEVATPPNAVQTRPVTNLSLTQFTANWDGSTQSAFYLFELSRNEAFTDLVSGFAPLETSNTSRVINFPEGVKTLYYRVRVRGIVGNNSVVSKNSNVQKVSILDTPTGFRVNNLAATSFRLEWSNVSGAEQYEISVSTNNFTTTLTNYNQLKINTLGINLENLEANRTYQIRVRALATNAISEVGNTAQMTLAPFPDNARLRRISTSRTTIVEIAYLNLPIERLSNLRFVVERSDAPDAPYRALSQSLRLEDNRTLVYNDVTGTQRLQAGYRIKITNDGGEVIYVIPNRVVTAIESNNIEDSKIIIYPNPSSDIFQIQAKEQNSKILSVKVFDNVGRAVKTWENVQNDVFDISNLSEGRYLVEVRWEKKTVYLHLIKQ